MFVKVLCAAQTMIFQISTAFEAFDHDLADGMGGIGGIFEMIPYPALFQRRHAGRIIGSDWLVSVHIDHFEMASRWLRGV